MIKAAQLSKIGPLGSEYIDHWIVKLIINAALKGESEVRFKYSWNKFESIPEVALRELGYTVGLDHPLEPKNIIIYGW